MQVSFTQTSKQRLCKLSILVLVLILAPFGLSYWHVHQWLAAEKCILYQSNRNYTVAVIDAFSGTKSGLVCKGHRKEPYIFNTDVFSQSPPSISRMVSALRKASIPDPTVSHYISTSANPREILRKLDSSKHEEHRPDRFVVYNYAEESLNSFSMFQRKTENMDLKDTQQVAHSYGFRRNPNKNTSSFVATSSRIPVATYFWLAINVGLYGWYLYKKIDPGKVSLNGQLLKDGGDFGRAFSGNLSHFEIWHLGLNAMSLLSLGEALEYDGDSLAMGGSIGLVLWTSSFVVMVAVGVVGLYVIDRRFGAGLWRSATARPFPSMVGFSGVLFAWSVARTLSLSEHQQTCPIPFFSNLCFSTHRLAGGFRFSWGPIIQLVVIQILLHKRVSFVGHLSGTIVGYLWHWRALPPLEISQPCVLYPILWMAGKSALYHWSALFEALAGTSEEHETGGVFAATRGSNLGGGQVLGSGDNRWTLSRASQEEEDEIDIKSRSVYFLQALQRFYYFHMLAMMCMYRKDYGLVILNSMVLSELLLLMVYSLFVRATINGGSNKHDRIHPLACLGVLGRAYVTFVVVAIISDFMAMGGWWAMLSYQETSFFVTLLLVSRLFLWILSMTAICHVLEADNELQTKLGGGNNFDVGGSVDGGIWTHVLGWTIAEPCLYLGRYIAKTKWKNNINASSNIVLVPKEEPKEANAGKSTSNVAGKSRLVDRGNIGNRGMV